LPQKSPPDSQHERATEKRQNTCVFIRTLRRGVEWHIKVARSNVAMWYPDTPPAAPN